jgi:hypothetical protein
MGAGCRFITSALKKKGIEFCWEFEANEICEKWCNHRAYGQAHDTFTCYQKLEDNIHTIQRIGIASFEKAQKIREQLLIEMLVGLTRGAQNAFSVSSQPC